MRGTDDFKRRLEGVRSFGEPGNPGKKGVVLMKVATILFCILTISIATATQTSDSSVTLYFFWGQGCSHCVVEKPFLDQLEQDYNVTINKYDATDETNKEIYEKFKGLYGLEYAGFPAAFIGDRYLVGDRAIIENLEDEVKRCIKEGCPCPLWKIRGMTPYLPKPGEITPEEERKIPISIPGFEAEIGVGTHILLLGIILGTVDGVNPCVIAVFLYLMGVLFGAGGERRKILHIGFLLAWKVVLAKNSGFNEADYKQTRKEGNAAIGCLPRCLLHPGRAAVHNRFGVKLYHSDGRNRGWHCFYLLSPLV